MFYPLRKENKSKTCMLTQVVTEKYSTYILLPLNTAFLRADSFTTLPSVSKKASQALQCSARVRSLI